MALNLDDVNKRKSSKVVEADVFSKLSEKKEYSFKKRSNVLGDSKEKVLRPWEVYDEGSTQTRTIVAQEAVKRARETVRKNNLYAKRLKEKFQKLEDEYEEKYCDGLEDELDNSSYTVKKSLGYFFTRLFN